MILLQGSPNLWCGTLACAVSKMENCTKVRTLTQQIDTLVESRNAEVLTFFHTVLVRVLLVVCLSLICAGDTLYALIEVVLRWSTCFRLLALCVSVSMIPSQTILLQIYLIKLI